ncbi:helix-turn-helix domain-containing protein [Mycolicibacterium neoaurum]|uniref:helix-turn-helix domain-containing protein n=1 Tax=Mycolicibacterium neoaurum TaxID=1795 RepID=UPI001F4CB3E4|nr:helix-turn-helix domain-containing protein [Mycolicibacterium neoaurum]
MSWDQLAAAVRKRRRELGLTQADVATAGHLSEERLRNIELRKRTPKRGLNPRTARALEDALKWEPGSVDDTLAGGRPTPIGTKSSRARKRAAQTNAGDHPTPEMTPTGVLPTAPAGLDTGDRFALARQILALRSALSEHQRAISPEAQEALMTELANSAREAEESIVRIMHLLDEAERGEAIQLLVKLREPLS